MQIQGILLKYEYVYYFLKMIAAKMADNETDFTRYTLESSGFKLMVTQEHNFSS